MNQGYVLIIDDDKDLCELLSALLKRAGYETRQGHDGTSALRLLAEREPDVLLLDTVIPEPNGMLVLAHAHGLYPQLPILMITGYGGIGGAILAIKSGAWDYLTKPFENSQVMALVCRAMNNRLGSQRARRETAASSENFARLLGNNRTLRCLSDDIFRVAHTSFSVIINGETGTGKELVAKSIHAASPRALKPFIAIDCGSIPDTLIENELFGHEKGAYTGANTQHEGKIKAADGGTLFLDEIANMSLSAQARLLRALQERVIYRVGGTQPIPVDIRVLVASNIDLMEAVIAGAFREDLYYRLNEYVIRIPPLRERPDDIIRLANDFRMNTIQELHVTDVDFSPDAIQTMLAYDWPGNVRELRSVVRRATLMAGQTICGDDLTLLLPKQPIPLSSVICHGVDADGMDSAEQSTRPVRLEGDSLKAIVQKNTDLLERAVIRQALLDSNQNKAEAARRLKIDYKTLFNKMKKLQLTVETLS